MSKRRCRALAAALLGLLAARSEANTYAHWNDALGEVGVSTSLRMGYWRQTRDVDSRHDILPATLWVKGARDLDADTSVVAEGWVQGQDLSRAASPEGELREFYLRGVFGDFDLRLGRQIVAWGRADRINPTDNLSTRDLTRLFPDDDDLRRGNAMLRASHALGPEMELQLYWVPEFRPEIHALGKRLGPFLIAGDQRPDGVGQGAVKLDGSHAGIDWSLSYFDGYDATGDLRPSRDLARPFDLLREYPRQRTLGADAAGVLHDVNLRAEFAYNDFPERARGTLSKQPFLFLVAGGDRNFGESVNLNLQYIYRHVSDHRPPERFASPYLRGIALINAIESGQRDDQQNGASARLAWTRSDQLLRAEAFAIHDFSHHDGFLRTQLRYEVSDDLRLTLGYEWNHGERQSLFGSRRSNNSAYLELRLGY